jgi:menaquinone-dependent protoporphyrinogen oxidase
MDAIMKPIGIFYATREGQTRRIAEYVGTALRDRGFEVRVQQVRDKDAKIQLVRYRAAVLAASVHAGQHEREMVAFVKQHLAELQRLPTAFLSVTLSEAGVERAEASPEQRARFVADVKKVLDQFFKQTGWHPERVKPVAGALLYTKYNFLVRFIMKRIARKAGAATDTSRDYEYTDWVALDRFVEELATEIISRSAQRNTATAAELQQSR